MTLEIGSRPESFEEGLLRLPPDDHPGLEDDEGMEHLHNLAMVLAETVYGKYMQVCLGERMAPLTLDDIQLLERWSFRRGEVIKKADWAAILDERNIWSDIYQPGDDFYNRWKICFMTPGTGNKEQLLICIETDSPPRGIVEPEFNVGIVTPEELRELINAIEKSNVNLKFKNWGQPMKPPA